MTLRVMDLFSGIGGFSLGLKRAGGFRTVCYCEIDQYCQRVLEARMHDGSLDTAPICTDIRGLAGGPWRGKVDVICGGFPCQDISSAGRKAGIEGEKSGLWKEIARLVRQVRPSYVIVENVSTLASRGLGVVLGDLAALGYDAEWSMLPACSMGAPQPRRRVFIVAYPHRDGQPAFSFDAEVEGLPGDAEAVRNWRGSQPGTLRMADGVPGGMVRLHAIGNAVVPQVVEWIGRHLS